MENNRDKTRLILTRFVLHSHPRFRGGSYSDFIGWSKPRIEVCEVAHLSKNEQIEFTNRNVELIDVGPNDVQLRITGLISQCKSEQKIEVRRYALNKPISTGHESGLYDATSEHFVACWTSRAKWIVYYYKTVLARSHEISLYRLHRIPSYFTKHAFMFYYDRFKYLLVGLYERLRGKS